MRRLRPPAHIPLGLLLLFVVILSFFTLADVCNPYCCPIDPGGGGGGPAPSGPYTDHGGVASLIRSWDNGTYVGEIDTTSYLTDSNGVSYQYTIDSTRVFLQEDCDGKFTTKADQSVTVPLIGDPTITHVNRATGGYANGSFGSSCPLEHALDWTFWWNIDTSYPTTYNHDGTDFRCHNFGGLDGSDPCYPFDY